MKIFRERWKILPRYDFIQKTDRIYTRSLVIKDQPVRLY